MPELFGHSLDEPALIVTSGAVGGALVLRFAVRRLLERILRRTPWGS